MKIAICAGEPSGDLLAADLITALKRKIPNVTFEGVAGDAMIAQGCHPLYPVSDLSVMGVMEVLPKLPRILKMRRALIEYFLANPPDLYIGVDAPDFNLFIEKALKRKGIKTIHYVSPTVWAWRKSRIHTIKEAVDAMICCFPFELDIYQKAGIPAICAGHSAFERLAATPDTLTLRKQLSLPVDAKIGALLPGSRSMELKYLGELFLKAAQAVSAKHPDIQWILPIAHPKLLEQWQSIDREGFVKVFMQKSADVIGACDVACVASGTATLETFILDKPMVVAYRMHAFNALLARFLVDIDYCALPNLLAGKAIVPEFLQHQATVENLTQALLTWFEQPEKVKQLKAEYATIKTQFSAPASEKAAEYILKGSA